MPAMRIPRHPVKAVLDRMGVSLQRHPTPDTLAETHPDLTAEPEFTRIAASVFPYTMTTFERLYSLYSATRYVVESGIDGAFVECGVWRGGSSMLMASTLAELGAIDRELWLYDTFEGMTDPTEHDRGLTEPTLNDDWNRIKGDTSNPVFAFAALDDVKRNLARTPFPADRIRYCKGPVEQTIPNEVPDKIALLRLDTDWYESTRHELEHLYPRLEPGGVLIIDDYGAWEGARRAVDEWRSTLPYPTLMHRIDETGGIIVKPAV